MFSNLLKNSPQICLRIRFENLRYIVYNVLDASIEKANRLPNTFIWLIHHASDQMFRLIYLSLGYPNGISFWIIHASSSSNVRDVTWFYLAFTERKSGIRVTYIWRTETRGSGPFLLSLLRRQPRWYLHLYRKQ